MVFDGVVKCKPFYLFANFYNFFKMVLTRSQENLTEIDRPANVSFTVNLDQDNTTRRTQTKQTDRSRGRPRTQNLDSSLNGQDDNIRVREIVSDSLNSFRNEITNLISNEIRSIFQNLNIQSNPNITHALNINNSDMTTPERENIHSSNSPSGTNPDSNQEPFYAEKVLNIIRNWRIKFSGNDSEMTVDEFIYRVNILTTNNLKGNFQLLCKHAHSLFEGKALVWFWRFHRQHDDDLDWITLTNALRKQYKVDHNDLDILEDIRRRKQKINENFDDYLDVISSMTDKLKTSINDRDMCEILMRNLKNEIRHELLHLEITSVSQLRREVRKHEKFMKDVHANESRRSTKGHVSELTGKDEKDSANALMDDNNEIYAIQNLKCWNCDKAGHTYIDCMDTRRVFCYGCGLKDIYRPTCPNCSRKPGNAQKDVRRK